MTTQQALTDAAEPSDAGRTVYELTYQERDNAIQAFTRAIGSTPDFSFAPDRAWLEGFAAAALHRPEQAEKGDQVLSALKGMHRFWSKYPAFVPNPQFREEVFAAIDAMNAAIDSTMKPAPHSMERS